jgi:hypothetical protein
MPASAEILVKGSANATISFDSDNIAVGIGSNVAVEGSGVTDGGLTVTGAIDVDDTLENGNFTDVYLTVGGTFGTIGLGTDAGPGTGGAGDSKSFAGKGYLKGDVIGAGGNPGISFAIPSDEFGGLSVGVSHQPDAATGGRNAIGVGFESGMGGANVEAGGIWASEDGTNEWGIGASVGVDLATVDIRYDNRGGDANTYGLGVSTVMGALTIGGGYGLDTDNAGAKESAIAAGAEYDLGGGAKASGAVLMVDPEGSVPSTTSISLRIALTF